MDSGTKKRALQKLHYGMYVMTSRSRVQCCAATVTWVSQASFHPPLIMAAVRKSSHLFKCVSESGIAVINILAQARLDVARKFFSGSQSTDGAFDDEPFTAGISTAPVLQSACAFMECRVHRILDDVGDHAVVIMEVVEAQCREDARPLTVAELPWKYAG
jgi:flavin reductase (DIM6/NTAB) family NADH-FMN oxidoreductase RutF